jgi:hypothetical protein
MVVEVRSGWRKLHSEEFCNLYFAMKLREMGRHVACVDESKTSYKTLTGKILKGKEKNVAKLS